MGRFGIAIIYMVFMCAFVECQSETEQVEAGNNTAVNSVDQNVTSLNVQAHDNNTVSTVDKMDTANNTSVLQESPSNKSTTASIVDVTTYETVNATTEAEPNVTSAATNILLLTSVASIEEESNMTKIDERMPRNETVTGSSISIQNVTSEQVVEEVNHATAGPDEVSTMGTENILNMTGSEGATNITKLESTTPHEQLLEESNGTQSPGKSNTDENALSNDVALLQALNNHTPSQEADTTIAPVHTNQVDDLPARLGAEDSETTNSTAPQVWSTTSESDVETTTEDKCEEDCDVDSVEKAEKITESTKQEEKNCTVIFEKVLEIQDQLRRKLKGQLAEHDIDHECNFEVRAKEAFQKLYYDTVHLLPAHRAEGNEESHQNHQSVLFQQAMSINLYSQIATVYLDALHDRNITLSRSLQNQILEVVTKTKKARLDPCYGEAYLVNYRDIIQKVWQPFIKSIKMESGEQHEHLAQYFIKHMKRLTKLIPKE